MRILWVVNSIFPYPASKLGMEKTCFGGWLNALYEFVSSHDDIEIAIATTLKNKKFMEFNDEKTKYYLIPTANPSKYNKGTTKYWKKTIDDFKPDLIHIHGTEYPRGLEAINSNANIKTVVAIQGLVSQIEKVYYTNIPKIELIKSITFRDIIKLNTVFDCKRDFKRRSKYELELLRKTENVIGRTLWDKSNILMVNKNIKYFKLNETLRPAFYESEKWDISKIEKHSLFCSQSSYPIKGLHVLLKSIYLLKDQYPNIKLYISGMNIIDTSSFIKRIKLIGYGKYIKKLIKKYNLYNNVEFVGYLNEKQVVNRLLKTHIYISPSFIENESNSLSEAGILGVPSIGSYVGGVTERIQNNVTGFQYPVTDVAMLSYYIKKIFDDDDIAIKISSNSIKMFEEMLNRNKNLKDILQIYSQIIEEKVVHEKSTNSN